MEAEGLVEALFDEIDRGAVDERQAVRIHEYLDALVLENEVPGLAVVGVVDDIGKPRAAGLAHAQAQSQSLASGGDEALDAFGSSRCERDGHVPQTFGALPDAARNASSTIS